MDLEEKIDGNGFVLRFENGHEYSVTNVAKLMRDTMSGCPTKHEQRQAFRLDEAIGKKYDSKGGRYEAILLSHRDEIRRITTIPPVIRGHSFNEVIGLVQEAEKNSSCCT